MEFAGRTVFAAVVVLVLAACTTDSQYNRAITDLDAQWKIENDKIFEEIGHRTVTTTKKRAFVAVQRATKGLGLVVEATLFYAGAGCLSGAAFSVVLGLTESRRRFDEMSLLRFAGWGVVGAGFLSMVFLVTVPVGAQHPFVVFVTLLGAVSAAGSLALARRAVDHELLEDGEDVAEIGLTEDEMRELLGKA